MAEGSKEKYEPVVVSRKASRQHSGSPKATGLTPPLEHRYIIVAQGIQFNNRQLPVDFQVPEYLKAKLGADLKTSQWKWVGKMQKYTSMAYYVSKVQGVRFTIEVVTDKREFRKALETRGMHVIYAGHARYGRGPCFGVFKEPGEDWNQGTGADAGMFRMGFRYIAVPASEILHYGYTPSLVKAAEGKPAPKKECHPEIRGHYGSLRTYSLADLEEALVKELHYEDDLIGKWADKPSGPKNPRPKTVLDKYNEESIRDTLKQLVKGDADDKYWGFDAHSHGFKQRQVIHHAGWTDTAGSPMDLGAIDMACRVFCHFGCSTLKHNQPILRGKRFKNWRQEGNEKFAFFTDNTAFMDIASRWIYHLLTYPEYNAFQSWKGSLDYARDETRRDLKDARRDYKVV